NRRRLRCHPPTSVCRNRARGPIPFWLARMDCQRATRALPAPAGGCLLLFVFVARVALLLRRCCLRKDKQHREPARIRKRAACTSAAYIPPSEIRNAEFGSQVGSFALNIPHSAFRILRPLLLNQPGYKNSFLIINLRRRARDFDHVAGEITRLLAQIG